MQALEKPLEPTRTVLITGFEDADEFERFKETNLPADKIIEHYTIPKTNFLFVIFGDARDAIKFVKNFSSETLSIQYTISKHEIPRKADECNEKNMQSSINFLFKGVDVNIEDSFIANFLKQYGDIRELRNSKPQQKTVEFYDIKSARKAFDALNDSPFGTGIVKCRWVWDISQYHRNEYLKRTDELLKEFVDIVQQEIRTNPKRVKLGGAGAKSPFIELFDDFIVDNLVEVERILKR